MKVRIDKAFEKDIQDVQSAMRSRVARIIEEVESAQRLNQISQIKKLKLGKNCFRIRVGDFRIGLVVENDIVEFVRCLPRKDLYKYFP